MSLRIKLGRSLIGLGKFIEAMPVLVLKPRDLVRFSREHYARPRVVASWMTEETLQAGLYDQERQILESLPQKCGDLLLLGTGGGREAIPLSQIGFRVTGVDFVADMVRETQAYGASMGVVIDGIVSELSDLELTPAAYDVIWFSTVLYSATPTRKGRTALLGRLKNALKPEGILVCQCMFNFSRPFRKSMEGFKRLIACLTLGNFGYQPGDVLWGNCEYIHQFTAEAELLGEVQEAGFRVIGADFPPDSPRGYVLLVVDERN